MFKLLTLVTLVGASLASPLLDLSINGPLLQGHIKIGSKSETSGFFSAESSLEQLLKKHLNHINDEAQLSTLFGEFKKLYGKVYKSTEEESEAKSQFAKRLAMILENNLKAAHGQSTFLVGLSPNSDRSLEQMLQGEPAGNWPLSSGVNGTVKIGDGDEIDEYAGSVDLRSQHQVTGVVNQGGCGACVYFAASAAIESYWARHGHGLVHLSPQQLNDCARDEAHGNHGCQHGGGTFVPTFNYIQKHGLTSTDNYPYQAKDGACLRDKEAHAVAHIKAWHPVTPHGNEDALARALESHGAIAVAVHVNDQFMHYRGGILDVACQGGRNHAVLVVGLGTDGGSHKDFWIIKNQWGTGWGEGGFMRLRRNHGNMCDVAGDAVMLE